MIEEKIMDGVKRIVINHPVETHLSISFDIIDRQTDYSEEFTEYLGVVKKYIYEACKNNKLIIIHDISLGKKHTTNKYVIDFYNIIQEYVLKNFDNSSSIPIFLVLGFTDDFLSSSIYCVNPQVIIK